MREFGIEIANIYVDKQSGKDFHVTTLNATDSSFVVKAVMTGDMDETNNSKDLTLAREHIVVTMDDYTMTNEFYILTVSVKNEGLFAATPTLECRLDADDGELLFTDAFILDAGETGHAIVRVNARDMYFDGNMRNLFIKTEGSTNGFFFVLYSPHEHDWTGPEWTWNIDHTEAEAMFTCTECLTQETVAATVTKENVDPTENTPGSITYTATVTGPNGRTYTDGDTIIISTLPNTEIRGATASFEGKIFINFYLNLPDEVKNNAGAYVLFTGGEGKRTQTVASALGRTKDIDGITCYGFTCGVVAKEIRDNINLKLYDGNGNIIRLTNAAGTNNYTETGVNYSLMTYANKMLNSATASDTMKALASAVIDYGTAAQIYFEYHNEGLSVSNTVTAVQLSDLEQYKAQFTGTNIVNGVPQLPDGITSRSISALYG